MNSIITTSIERRKKRGKIDAFGDAGTFNVGDESRRERKRDELKDVARKYEQHLDEQVDTFPTFRSPRSP